MQQAERKQILIPQFSIRWLLAVTAVCAVVFSIFGLAVRGSPWAAGVSIAIVSLVVVFLVHVIVFALVWAFSVFSQSLGRSAPAGRSPFSPQAGSPVSDSDVPATPVIVE